MRKDKIVLTTGCFDLFHTGHLSLLKYCKSLGQYLIVGINSDDYVRATKGKNRPIIGENDRLKIIQSIKYVDFAYVFNSKSAVSEIQLIRPDIFVMNSESIKLFPILIAFVSKWTQINSKKILFIIYITFMMSI